METDGSAIAVVQSDKFIRELKILGKRYDSVRKDIEPLIEQLRIGETPGDRITGNRYPVYKVRVKNSDARRGKSGGYRVIYYIQTPEAIKFMKRYPKIDIGLNILARSNRSRIISGAI